VPGRAPLGRPDDAVVVRVVYDGWIEVGVIRLGSAG
jgi:hypothetical protein